MVGLIDIAPSKRTVHYNGDDIPVPGVSAKGLAYLFDRFPDIAAALSGGEASIDRLRSISGDAVSAIIAAGCGYPGNADVESKAEAMPLDAQVDFIVAIMKQTMPKGVGPFVDKVKALTDAFTVGEVVKVRERKSPQPSN